VKWKWFIAFWLVVTPNSGSLKKSHLTEPPRGYPSLLRPENKKNQKRWKKSLEHFSARLMAAEIEW